MASQRAPNQFLGEKPTTRRSGKSPSRSPARSPARSNGQKQQKQKAQSYASDGVKNNDIFNLPGSDWQLLAVLTAVASIVRLFRIAQPSSVVFDEVQYVRPARAHTLASANTTSPASVASRPSTSRANSSWTYIRRSPRCSSR
jgi:hypothetical protein